MSLETKVFITDPSDFGFSAQDMAMAASVRSRSKKSMKELTAKVLEEGSDKFMETYYIPYGNNGQPGTIPGHGSICQSGSFTFELEGISMLAALAFEDHALFNGQESSTRYISWEEGDFVMPMVHEKDKAEAKEIIETWFKIYKTVYDGYLKHLQETQEKPEDLDQKTFDKALKAAAFDKASGYIPAAAKTNVSWHTHIDNANTQIQRLKSFPLNELRVLAGKAEEVIAERYPNSAKRALPEGHREYLDKYAVDLNYSEISTQMANAKDSQFVVDAHAETFVSCSLEDTGLQETYSSNLLVSQNTEELLLHRPKYMYPPQILKTIGYIQFHGCIDLASFRDLHRHRDGNIPMPFLYHKFGLHSWYQKDLPPRVMIDTFDLIQKQFERLAELQRRNPFEAQYCMPLALRVPFEGNWQVPQIYYIAEKRSGHDCREPLRKVAQLIGKKMKDLWPEAANYTNFEDEKPYYYERGKADIYKVGPNGEKIALSEEAEVATDESNLQEGAAHEDYALAELGGMHPDDGISDLDDDRIGDDADDIVSDPS